MDVEGYLILSTTQMAEWKAAFGDEYKYYVDNGYLDEETGYLYDEPPGWMFDEDEGNGPFDFALHPSQATYGW